jgi:hypothetical protein
MELIEYTPALEPIANLDILGRGTGSRYLECIRSHTGQLIAKQWRFIVTESIAKKAEVIVRFGGPHSNQNLGR